MKFIHNIIKSKILNPTEIGILNVKTGLILWVPTKFLLNNFCETKLGLLTFFDSHQRYQLI